jgi:TIR domain
VAKKLRRVFISHASDDRRLAIELKNLIQRSLAVDVFCSSDVGDIEPGKKWFDQIMDHLKQANVCIAIMTPNSVYFSPWVAYEAGGAYLRFETNPNSSSLFVVSACGLTPRDVPSPFRELQIQDLAQKKEVRVLLAQIAKRLHVNYKQNKRAERVVTTVAAEGSPHWGHVSLALVGERQQWSPFSFEPMLKRATSDFFCAGFNLKQIATSPKAQSRVLTWLKESPERSVRILISDQMNARTYLALQNIDGSHLKDLRNSVAKFRSWQAAAKRLRLGPTQLDIRKAPFIALTVLAIDTDSVNAQIVLTPTIWGKHLSPDRPHVCLSRRRQPAVFAYYWNTYYDLFDYAKPL